MLGDLFEQFVGIELIYHSQLHAPGVKIKYWRDSAGPEVDYVIDSAHTYLPVEVKWTDKPNLTDAKPLIKFIDEYGAKQGFVICRTPHRYKLAENILALPWQEMDIIFTSLPGMSSAN